MAGVKTSQKAVWTTEKPNENIEIKVKKKYEMWIKQYCRWMVEEGGGGGGVQGVVGREAKLHNSNLNSIIFTLNLHYFYFIPFHN